MVVSFSRYVTDKIAKETAVQLHLDDQAMRRAHLALVLADILAELEAI